jgi:hypothetical protein
MTPYPMRWSTGAQRPLVPQRRSQILRIPRSGPPARQRRPAHRYQRLQFSQILGRGRLREQAGIVARCIAP